jgi:hypothetical protein
MTDDEEAKAVWEFLHKMNRLTAWDNGLYRANCGCIHRFHEGDELPLACLTHKTEVEWILHQKLT